MLSGRMNKSPAHKTRIAVVGSSSDSGILNERILVLVFDYLKWDIRALCQASSVNRRLRALAKRLLWLELCAHHAPRMMRTLTEGESNTTRIIGGWHALAKLLFFCGGSQPTLHFNSNNPSSGHFVESSRFSKTSGRSFLAKKCRGDVLYVSDPCEHAAPAGDRQDLLGIYRGVFRGFMKSKTRECLIRRQAELEAKTRCPYCGARVWSMTAARLIPRKSAARRLGSSDGELEYFVCLNGHLHGTCWLVPLSTDDEETDDGAEEEDNGGGGRREDSGGSVDDACEHHGGPNGYDNFRNRQMT